MKYSNYPDNASFGFYCRWTLKIFSIVLLVLAISGCLSRPAMNKQTFMFSAPELPNNQTTGNGQVLAIRTLQIAPPFDGRALVYRTGEFSYERDPYAEFLASPADLLVAPVSNLLLKNGCFSSVVRAGGAVKPDALAEISVTQLYGDIRNPGSPAAVLALHVIFLQATNGLPGKVILQQNYSRRVLMKSSAPAVLMESWNQALVGIFDEAATDFRRQVTVK